ncbi:uncharacterized protein LOC143202164 [Rhynchophorus ferrugineus]|uniref:uncharacterized protein LOC143202164 n=1 Tax=Rhynchophorus ferrugineus TaxID=354439 RepID=UPI003FCC614B
MRNAVLLATVTSFIVLSMVKVTPAWNDSVKFIVSKESVTFLDAYIRCHQHGFDAVEILSEEDEREVEYVLERDSSIVSGWQNGVWLFAANFGKTCNYHWIDSESH